MNPFPDGETIDVTSAGDYILTVINCDNGCSTTATATVGLDADVPNVSFMVTAGQSGPLTCTNVNVEYLGVLAVNDPDVTLTWTDMNGNVVPGLSLIHI